jgi:hypothetical protein
MRKTILYLVILAVLGTGIYFFLIRKSDSPYSSGEAGFTIKDTASIGRLFIAANDGASVLVERTDSGWVVNKQYKALKSTLDLLLTTLYQQATVYPVTKNAYENVVKTMSTHGIKVEVYGRDGKKMSIFYVGGAAANNTGTNMLMEGASTPYVVHITNFNGALTPRYATELTYWRDRTVFNIPAEEIKTISVQYYDQPLNSFEIKRKKDTILISADPRISEHLDGPNTRRARVYMKYFTNVNCEGYLNGLPDNDTTIKTAPRQSSIDVTGINGQHQHVDVYWMALNRRSKNRTTANPNVPDNYDADRLYAVINNFRDTVMIQQYAFRDIFHNAYEFFQKDGTPVKTIMPQTTDKNILMRKGQ